MNNSERQAVIVVGASRSRAKYGNKAVRAYLSQGYRVFPVNPSADEIEGEPAFATLNEIPEETVDQISVYLPPETGIGLAQSGKRIPGITGEGRGIGAPRRSSVQHSGSRADSGRARNRSGFVSRRCIHPRRRLVYVNLVTPP